MCPADLAARVSPADRQLPPGRRVADPDLDPGPDRIAVRGRLSPANGEPVRGLRSRSSRSCSRDAGIPPDPNRILVEDLDEVGQAIEVEVGERRAASPAVVDDAGRLGVLDEGSIRLTEEEIGRVLAGIVGLLVDI